MPARKTPWRTDGSPLQYSCLGNPLERDEAGDSPWGCKEKNQTRRSDWTTTGKTTSAWRDHQTELCADREAAERKTDPRRTSLSDSHLGRPSEARWVACRKGAGMRLKEPLRLSGAGCRAVKKGVSERGEWQTQVRVGWSGQGFMWLLREMGNQGPKVAKV